MLYFAYASNMNREHMKKLCPESTFVQRARLLGYRFVYDGAEPDDGGAVGNIVASKKDVVLGALFEITKKDLSQLDWYENYPQSYGRTEVAVFGDDDKEHTAIVYFRVGETPADPLEEYRELVLQGARDCRLPEKYISDNL